MVKEVRNLKNSKAFGHNNYRKQTEHVKNNK